MSHSPKTADKVYHDIPKTLYHATYRPLLDSILAHGLGNPEHRQNKMWSDSEPDKVYLACDKYVAISFAETSEFLEDESWIDDIVVLAVKTSDLDHSKFEWDKNILDNDGYSWAYRGMISAHHFSVLENLSSEDEEDSGVDCFLEQDDTDVNVHEPEKSGKIMDQF